MSKRTQLRYHRTHRISLNIARLWREAHAATRACRAIGPDTPVRASNFVHWWESARSPYRAPRIGHRLARIARRRDIANDIGPEVFG